MENFTLPLWVFLGMGSSVLSAFVMLIQERRQAEGFSVAVWNKIGCVAIMLPFVMTQGFPDNPYFYMLLFLQALIWVISDVVFFRSLPSVGAGVMSRLQPLAVIITFVMWFVIDPKLLDTYLQTPVRFALICVVLFAASFFASRLKSCAVSWQAVKTIWFVLVASVVGPIMAKLVMSYAPIEKAPFAWVFCEGIIMISLWGIYYALKKPVAWAILTRGNEVKTGLLISGVSSFMVVLNVSAIHFADNPAYLPAIKFVDSLFILWVYRMTGKKENANVWAGIGVVACAAALVLLKSWNG